MNRDEDTIVAPATAVGEGAVAIVRLSGLRALAIADSILRRGAARPFSEAEPRRMVNASVVIDDAVLDDCLAVWFQSPASFTGEDVVEIHCHGNPLIVDRIVAASVQGGARPASRGEFSRRAFINGKLDLTQAEAIGELIRAETETAAKVARRQLGGSLGREFEQFRESVVSVLALLELELDFVEEDYRFTPREDLVRLIDGLRQHVQRLLASYRSDSMWRRGRRIVLCGLPNAGKSSLFNAFVGFSRAIVSPHAGTTRDYLEERIIFDGVSLSVVDTAGMRDTSDLVEAAGVSLAREQSLQSDVVLFLVDSTTDSADALAIASDLRSTVDVPVRLVWTKVDVPNGVSYDDRAISVFRRDSVESLLREIAADTGNSAPESAVLLNRRQVSVLERLQELLAPIDPVSTPSELISSDLRLVLDALEELTGRRVDDDILDAVFSSYCIGK